MRNGRSPFATPSLPACAPRHWRSQPRNCHGPQMRAIQVTATCRRTIGLVSPGWPALRWAMTMRYRGAHPSLRSKERQHF
jgi:hypothetical protein